MHELQAKILIAEDDKISRLILVKLVRSLGHISIEASNGLNALNILEDNPDISLLITDMMMPEMDGKELVKRIRSHDTLSRLPVLMISAVVPLRDILGTMDLGVSRFSPKPVNLKDIAYYIKTLLSSAQESTLEDNVNQPPTSQR